MVVVEVAAEVEVAAGNHSYLTFAYYGTRAREGRARERARGHVRHVREAREGQSPIFCLKIMRLSPGDIDGNHLTG